MKIPPSASRLRHPANQSTFGVVLFQRQRVLLRLVTASGGRASRLGLVKLAFALAHESETKGGDGFYDFVASKLGPYSFSLARDTDTLMSLGYLSTPDEKTWATTPSGDTAGDKVGLPVARDADGLARRWTSKPVSALVAHVYANHPWFTINAANEQRRRAKRPTAAPAVHTVGYEGLSVDAFLDLLMRAGISRLVDVRANPIARRFGFHKSTLARLCSNVDIDYVHVPELGIPTRERVGLEEEDRGALFTRYRKTTLVTQQSAIVRIAAMLKDQPSALLCQEADPGRCHRAHLARALHAATDLPVVNLGWPR